MLCVECFGLLCKTLSWNNIKKQLKKYISFLTSDKYDEKVIVKLISGILDNMSELP